jgi:hypothetical protein
VCSHHTVTICLPIELALIQRKAFELTVLKPEMLGLQAVQKSNGVSVRTDVSFRLDPFRNRGQIRVRGKVVFSNNLAPAWCERSFRQKRRQNLFF